MNELHNRILEKAHNGVRLRDIPGERYGVVKAFKELIDQGKLIERVTFDRGIKVYFDSKESAARYFAGATSLRSPEVIRPIETNPLVQVIPTASYEQLAPSKVSSGWYDRL